MPGMEKRLRSRFFSSGNFTFDSWNIFTPVNKVLIPLGIFLLAGKEEVYYADFDGAGKDLFCEQFGVCTPQLPNDKEASIGGGDSGGPSFIVRNGELMLVANNTFSGIWNSDDVEGTFGTYFGGIVLGSYTDYLNQATGGQATFVPEPGSMALLALGGALLGGLRRRRKQ